MEVSGQQGKEQSSSQQPPKWGHSRGYEQKSSNIASPGCSFKEKVQFAALRFYKYWLPGDNELVNRDKL